MALEEYRFLVAYHQTVEKERQKALHDRHIKRKTFGEGYMILMYYSKFSKPPGKLKMHWLRHFVVADIIETRANHLAQLDGTLQPRWVKGTRLKPYSTPGWVGIDK